MTADGFHPITLTTPEGAMATLCPYGAHLTSWRLADGTECLFTSSKAEFRPGAAIRGGVPVIFPQFAGFGALPKHGFARTSVWQYQGTSSHSPHRAQLRWRDDAATRSIWPHAFTAEFTVELQAESLKMTLHILNSGAEKLAFTAALHTYLRVRNIEQVGIQGLQGLRYRDSAAGGAEHEQVNAELHISGEVDRIYFSAYRPILVAESGQRTIECQAAGFADAVVWNPGSVKGAALADMEIDGYRRMLCIEAAAIAEPIVLQPDREWSGTQYLKVL